MTTVADVRAFLLDLQQRICNALTAQEQQGGIDGATSSQFLVDDWQRPITQGGGGGRSCVMQGGPSH